MKRYFSKAICFLILFFAVGITNVSAKELNELPDLSYVIGTYEFSPNTALTTERIMWAARTIEGENLSLEDMVIFYKNVDSEWINAATGELIPIAKLPTTFDIEYEDDEFVGADIKLMGAKNALPEELRANNPTMNEQHARNQSSFTVTTNGNDILVKETFPMVSYDNDYLDKEWYGLVLDLNIPLENLESVSGYTIEDIDRQDGHIYGATKETEVLLWLQGGDENSTRYIVFKNTETNKFITVTIRFDAVYKVDYIAVGDVVITSNQDEVTYDIQHDMFIVNSEVNEFTFTEDGIASRVIDGVISSDLKLDNVQVLDITDETGHEHNQAAIRVVQEGNTINVYKNKPLEPHKYGAPVEAEWYALLLSIIGLRPEIGTVGYSINPIDLQDVVRFGGTLDRDVIIWLKAEDETRSITFINSLNSKDTLTITINVIQDYPLELKGVQKPEDVSLNADTQEMNDAHSHNQAAFTPSFDGATNTITIEEDTPMISYHNGHADREWYGLLVDLNVPFEDIDAIDGYAIEDIDRLDGARWGATGNKILLWLQGGDEDFERVIVFKNLISGEEITITIDFKAVSGVNYEALGTVDNILPESGIRYDGMNSMFIVGSGITEFTFEDDGVEVTATKGLTSWDFVTDSTELNDAKTSAKSELLGVYTGKNEEDYTSENWVKIVAFKTAGDTAIDAATTLAEIDSAKTTAITGINNVKTIAEEELLEAKEVATNTLMYIFNTIYAPLEEAYDSNWLSLVGAYDTGISAIEDATSTSNVTTALADALRAMAAIEIPEE